MVLSMTGFGSTNLSNNGFTTEVEIRCLNSKFLDLSLRIPKALNPREAEIREIIQSKLQRGKVSISIEWREVKGSAAKVEINRNLLKEYYHQLKQAQEELGAEGKDLFRIALNMPDVVESHEDDQVDKKWELTRKAIENAMSGVEEFRKNEGKKLEDHLSSSIQNISGSLQKVRSLAPERSVAVREKISNALEEWKEDHNVDQNRFEQELIYYLEKLDIEEEVVRLDSHLKHFLEVMSGSSNGKRLNFISQEMGREINTMGAKANNAGIQKTVVDMKEELEKIREQIQNVV